MGLPLAGGPDDDVSRLLSRDLLQQHMEKGRSPLFNGPAWPPTGPDSPPSSENFFHMFEDALLNPFAPGNTRRRRFVEEIPQPTTVAMPSVASSDTPIPLPHTKPETDLNMAGCDDFELDNDAEGLLLSDNAPLFMKLR